MKDDCLSRGAMFTAHDSNRRRFLFAAGSRTALVRPPALTLAKGKALLEPSTSIFRTIQPRNRGGALSSMADTDHDRSSRRPYGSAIRRPTRTLPGPSRCTALPALESRGARASAVRRVRSARDQRWAVSACFLSQKAIRHPAWEARGNALGEHRDGCGEPDYDATDLHDEPPNSI